MKIVTPDEMRRLEQEASRYGLSTDDLMERAGLAIALETARALGTVAGKRILVLVGPGNNGGDGLVASRHLARRGALVTLYMTSERREDDTKLRLALNEEAVLVNAATDEEFRDLARVLNSADVVLDSVLGTGRSRPLRGTIREVMLRLSKRKGLLIAVDVPTGVDAGTGQADPAAPKADLTLALGFPKVGHFLFPAAERVGTLKVLDIGIPQTAAKDVTLEMLTPSWVRDKLPQRFLDGHKGTFGHTLIIGGSASYPGAACLATEAALRSGAGLVTLAAPQSIQSILAPRLTEAIHLPLPDGGLQRMAPQAVPTLKKALHQYTSLAIGCGMGRSNEAIEFLEMALLSHPRPTQPLVVDADGLNNLSQVDEWWTRLKAPAILTPHPGEMARLTRLSTTEVQARRMETAREWSEKWGKVVVLKGAFTVIAAPSGHCWIAPFANPILATGGTGDVLTGIIAGLLAQGMSPEHAAACGVYLHGAAAESLKETYGDRGAKATDIIDALPRVTKELIES